MSEKYLMTTLSLSSEFSENNTVYHLLFYPVCRGQERKAKMFVWVFFAGGHKDRDKNVIFHARLLQWSLMLKIKILIEL